MCSVIGYKGKFDKDLVGNLLDESRVRGVHAFGWSSDDYTFKSCNYDKFKKSLLDYRPELFVAHLRYSTSGDYRKQENNQPLVKDNTSIVFNGVISQLTKSEMEAQFDTTLPSYNDGWLLLDNIDEEEFLSNSRFTIATTYHNGESLFAFKNNHRPLYYNSNPNRVVVASTNDIMIRSGLNKNIPLKPYSKYEW